MASDKGSAPVRSERPAAEALAGSLAENGPILPVQVASCARGAPAERARGPGDTGQPTIARGQEPTAGDHTSAPDLSESTARAMRAESSDPTAPGHLTPSVVRDKGKGTAVLKHPATAGAVATGGAASEPPASTATADPRRYTDLLSAPAGEVQAPRVTASADQATSPAIPTVSSRGEVIPPLDLQDPGTPAAQLRARWWKLKESRIRVDGPSMTTRVSGIGEECERRLVYARTVRKKDRVPHGPGLQAIFDLGNVVESNVIHELESMGCVVEERGTPYLDRERELSAHTDVRVRLPGWKRGVVAEIKGLNPATAGQIETIDHIQNHRQAWVRKYFAQLQGYLGMDALERLGDDGAPFDALGDYLEDGLFILANKSTGVIVFIDCPADLEFILGLFGKAERIRDAVRAGVLPDRHVSDDCDRCPFNLVCAPPRTLGPGAEFLSEELAGLLERRDALKAAHKEYEDLHEEAKALIPPKVGEYAAGPYLIRVTERSRKATAATTFLNREIKRNGA